MDHSINQMFFAWGLWGVRVELTENKCQSGLASRVSQSSPCVGTEFSQRLLLQMKMLMAAQPWYEGMCILSNCFKKSCFCLSLIFFWSGKHGPSSFWRWLQVLESSSGCSAVCQADNMGSMAQSCISCQHAFRRFIDSVSLLCWANPWTSSWSGVMSAFVCKTLSRQVPEAANKQKHRWKMWLLEEKSGWEGDC